MSCVRLVSRERETHQRLEQQYLDAGSDPREWQLIFIAATLCKSPKGKLAGSVPAGFHK